MTGQWIDQEQLERVLPEARIAIRNSGTPLAMQALYDLTVAAATGTNAQRRIVAAVKDQVVRRMIDRYSFSVTQAVIELPCHACDEGYDRQGNPCRQCGGSGMYNLMRLFQFCISVDGVDYHWNVPSERLWSRCFEAAEQPLKVEGWAGARHVPLTTIVAFTSSMTFVRAYIEWLDEQTATQ